MNPELSRRQVLRAGGAGVVATLLGWYIPNGSVRVVPLGDPDPIPESATEVNMQFGAVVGATYGAIDEAGLDALRALAFERIRNHYLAEIAAPGWIAVECLWDREYEVPPGGDHADPLRVDHLFGVKQDWRMVRA